MVVGGVEAFPGEFPHQVGITYDNDYVCGGSIISPILVLTAAHCVLSPWFTQTVLFEVFAGVHNLLNSDPSEQTREIKRIYGHESFNQSTYENDIAVLLLSKPFRFTSTIKNLELPTNGETFYGRAVISGWGQTKLGGMGSSKLRRSRVPIISIDECTKSYRGRFNIKNGMFCMERDGKGSCQGDGGGAAICSRSDFTLVQCGIISFGMGCGGTYPGVYTLVSNYIDWIDEKEKEILESLAVSDTFVNGTDGEAYFTLASLRRIPKTNKREKSITAVPSQPTTKRNIVLGTAEVSTTEYSSAMAVTENDKPDDLEINITETSTKDAVTESDKPDDLEININEISTVEAVTESDKPDGMEINIIKSSTTIKAITESDKPDDSEISISKYPTEETVSETYKPIGMEITIIKSSTTVMAIKETDEHDDLEINITENVTVKAMTESEKPEIFFNEVTSQIPQLNIADANAFSSVGEVNTTEANTVFISPERNITNNTRNNTLDISTSQTSWNFYEVIIGILSAAILVGLCCAFYKKYSSSGKGVLTAQEIDDFRHGNLNNEYYQIATDDVLNTDALKMPYNKLLEIPKDKLNILKNQQLGGGEFGCVFKAILQHESDIEKEVAVKTTKPTAGATALRGLLSEIKILTYLGHHPNIVPILGAQTTELCRGIVYVATELCALGSLKACLKTYRDRTKGQDTSTVPFDHMSRWSYEIASGMEYLEEKRVIHADLATRNVLLSSENTAKITDFGLSRRLYEYTNYTKTSQEPLPWRWMALESLKAMEFSSKSDVWSYGVTLWEIFSLGAQPYPGLSWSLDFVETLEDGLRLKQPRYATSEIFDIMEKCWTPEPNERPSFSELKDLTRQIQIKTMEELYTSLNFQNV